MIANARVKFGLVGTGAIAQSYLAAFKETEIAQLVAVADVRREAAEAVAAAHNCQAFDSHEAMADAVPMDAVIVCTPPSTHRDVCVHLVNKGINVLCEKPLSIDSQSAVRMLDAAADAGVLFTMASKFRYVDDVKQAKALVASGIVGEVVLFENAFTGFVDMSKRWNSNAAMSGGGVLIDNGTHSVDVMRYILGPLAELQVVEGKRIQALPVEDTVRMFVRSEAGVMGTIDLSWSINKELPNYISIYGSKGTIQVGWKESKYRRSGDAQWTVFGSGYNKFQAFRSQIENFARAIRGEEDLLITGEDALASVQVIETAYQALHGSKWQPVKRHHEPVAASRIAVVAN